MGKNKILLTVDSTDASGRAVDHVAEMASFCATFEICLLHVFPTPPPDFFVEGHDLNIYRKEREARAEDYIKKYRQKLVDAGIDKQHISIKIIMAESETISECVLKEQKKGDYGIVVAGKRGVSKAEEFIFGSISNTLARNCTEFTAWIVG